MVGKLFEKGFSSNPEQITEPLGDFGDEFVKTGILWMMIPGESYHEHNEDGVIQSVHLGPWGDTDSEAVYGAVMKFEEPGLTEETPAPHQINIYSFNQEAIQAGTIEAMTEDRSCCRLGVLELREYGYTAVPDQGSLQELLNTTHMMLKMMEEELLDEQRAREESSIV